MKWNSLHPSFISPTFVQHSEFGNPDTIGCTPPFQFPIPLRVKWGWKNQSYLRYPIFNRSSLTFYFADEGHVFKIMLKKHVRVQLVFLIIQQVGSPCWNMPDATSDISRGNPRRREKWNVSKNLLKWPTLLIFAADEIRKATKITSNK